ncbi:MAG TPA: hypothetical protein VGI86_03125, partial [Acidimicrobiia bacterium]
LGAYAARAGGGRGERLAGAPESFTSFIGRADALAAVATALEESRLVTLTGPGGIGKTRLAIEAGRRSGASGKWFVDLVPAREQQVVATLAAALGVDEQPDQSLERSLHGGLVGRPTLVVIDNCEHVLDEVASVVARLLQRCPDATILATSREALGVPGEHNLVTRPLPIEADEHDGAVALFVTRATAAGASLRVDDRTRIAEVCARLDGMPLAIELAAARCATLGLDGIAGALGDRLRLLAGARGAEDRHRSIRTVLDWSYELLDDDERAVARWIAAFHGPFALDDAATVLRDRFDAAASADIVGRLAAKSLVVRMHHDDGPSRYRVLETMREYGLAKLAECGEDDFAHAQHLQWASERAEAFEDDLVQRDTPSAELDSVFDDLRGALAWAVACGRRSEAHALARRLARLAYGRRFMSESIARYREAATLAGDDADAARDLVTAGDVAFAFMHGNVGFDCYVEAGERAEAGGDDAEAAHAYALAAERAHRYPAEFRTVPEREVIDTLAERAHRLAEQLDGEPDPLLAAQLANTDAWLSTTTLAAATLPAAERAWATARALNDPPLESSALDALAAAHWVEGRLAEAARVTTTRIELLEQMPMHDSRNGCEQVDILHMASETLLARGDLRTAHTFSTGAVHHPLAAGARLVMHRELVTALCLTGRFDEAIDEAALLHRYWEQNGQPIAVWMGPAAYLTALVYGLRGEHDAYERWWEFGTTVCPSAADNGFRAFTAMRLALHHNRLDDAVAVLDRYQREQSGGDASSPWSVTPFGFMGYAWAIAADVFAARDDPTTLERIEQVRRTYAEHVWVQPCLERAEGRFRRDPARLRAAADGFAAIDARFEQAAALALLDGQDGAAGRAALRELGCTAVAPPI